MNVLHLNASDIKGGAARAAYRLHQGLQSRGVSSRMLVRWKHGDSQAVIGPGSKIRHLVNQIRPNLVAPLIRWVQASDADPRSINLLPSGLSRRINALDVDVVNLHWINGEMMSIADVARIKKPLVWTLHDMWPFCGAEHYTETSRYQQEYASGTRLPGTRGFDLDRRVWRRKKRCWKDVQLRIVTPSRWLAECARSSSLFAPYPIDVIPNGIDTRLYKPLRRDVARTALNLPLHKTLLLFGAMHATGDRRKGFHVLTQALERLSHERKGDTELVVFGASTPREPAPFSMKAHYLGSLQDDVSLALLYAAADVFVAPSLQDNLPNTVLEAMACGTPCAAFDTGGLPDMIDHRRTGYLARPFDPGDLAQGIQWILEDTERHNALGRTCRSKIEARFSLETQAQAYLDLYRTVLSATAPASTFR